MQQSAAQRHVKHITWAPPCALSLAEPLKLAQQLGGHLGHERPPWHPLAQRPHGLRELELALELTW